MKRVAAVLACLMITACSYGGHYTRSGPCEGWHTDSAGCIRAHEKAQAIAGVKIGQSLAEVRSIIEAKSLRFEHRASTEPATLQAFTGSDWAFSGNLVTLDQAFENGWLAEKAKDRLRSRQSLEAYLPIQTSDSWEQSYRPVCTTLGEVEKEIVAAGLRFDGLSRQCAYFSQPSLLRLQDKKESGNPLNIDDVGMAMAAVCKRDNAERVVLRFSDKETQVRLTRNSLNVPRSALADLLLAPGDRIYTSPRKR